MAKSWKDVTPSDREWQIKRKLDQDIHRLNMAAIALGVLFVLALIANRIWHWSLP